MGLREKLPYPTPLTRRDTESFHGGGTEGFTIIEVFDLWHSSSVKLRAQSVAPLWASVRNCLIRRLSHGGTRRICTEEARRGLLLLHDSTCGIAAPCPKRSASVGLREKLPLNPASLAPHLLRRLPYMTPLTRRDTECLHGGGTEGFTIIEVFDL